MKLMNMRKKLPENKLSNDSISFKFDNFRIINLNFQITKNKPLKPKTVGFKISVSGKHISKQKRILSIIEIKVDDEKLPFTLSLKAGGMFSGIESKNKETLNRLIKINFPAIIFPFVRETIADITRRAGFGSFYLPTINFVALSQSAKQHKIMN